MRKILTQFDKKLGSKWQIMLLALVILLFGVRLQFGHLKVAATQLGNHQYGSLQVHKQLSDSVRSAGYVKAAMPALAQDFDFIKFQNNYLQLPQSVSSFAFFKALSGVDTTTVRILHIGDSHVQAGMLTNAIASDLQEAFGVGGRGLVFPYKAARTNAPEDYTSNAKGIWQVAKNINRVPSLPLGVTGISIATVDVDAGFGIAFKNIEERPVGNLIKIFCSVDSNAFAVRVKVNGIDTILSTAPAVVGPVANYLTLLLKETVNTPIEVSLVKQRTSQRYFHLYGLYLENTEQGGVVYSSAGINGARVLDVLKQGLLVPDLQAINPNLIVLDVGVNDYYLAKVMPGYFTDSLLQLVQLVHAACPEANILLCNQQPNKRRKKAVTPASSFHAVNVTVAQEAGPYVAAYDFYKVTDSPNSVANWQQNRLMQPDGIHLTYNGYKTKGALFCNALLEGYIAYLQKQDVPKLSMASYPASIVAGVTENQLNSADGSNSITVDTEILASSPQNKENESIYLDVSPRSKKLSALEKRQTAQRLREAKREKAKAEAAQDEAIPDTEYERPAKVVAAKKITLKPGETLYALALEYGVSVKEIMAANKLGNGKIRAGDRLIIPAKKAEMSVNHKQKKVATHKSKRKRRR